MNRIRLLAVCAFVFCLLNALAALPESANADIGPRDATCVSVDASGAPVYAERPSLSSDGRYVAFEAWEPGLVPDDMNETMDIFVRDTVGGVTTRVSVDSHGAESDGDSRNARISPDGRYVAFESDASNLVNDDTNGTTDVFVHDRVTGVTSRVSVDSAGQQGDADSTNPCISSDGRFVAYESRASNLAADDTNGVSDVFVRDRVAGTTTRVSVASSGAEGTGTVGSSRPSISQEGRYVAFDSDAPGLVDGDTNDAWDVFVRDRVDGATTLESVDSSGTQGRGLAPAISADGRYVAFDSAAPLVPDDTNGLNDVYVRDRLAGATTRASVDSNGAETQNESFMPSISADGRYVVYSVTEWHPIDTRIRAFLEPPPTVAVVHDRVSGTSAAMSVDDLYGQAYPSEFPAVSGDGAVLGFSAGYVYVIENGPDVAPVALDDRGGPLTVPEDTELVVAAPGVLANDVLGSRADTLTAELAAAPAHGTVALAADGSFRYMPAADYNGTDRFTYRAYDGGAYSASATVEITVTPVNDAPTAVPDTSTCVGDTSMTIAAPGILGNDTDAEHDALTAELVSAPAHGTVAIGADGSYAYVPTHGFVGSDSFAYRVRDADLYSEPASVTIDVTPPPVLPTPQIGITSSAWVTVTGRTVVLAGAVSPQELVGRPVTVFVMKPGRRYWSYSSNRTVYAPRVGAAWQYKYLFKRGMTKGPYKFKAVFSPAGGYAAASSPVISVRLR